MHNELHQREQNQYKCMKQANMDGEHLSIVIGI